MLPGRGVQVQANDATGLLPPRHGGVVQQRHALRLQFFGECGPIGGADRTAKKSV